jgi:hypothetical protein
MFKEKSELTFAEWIFEQEEQSASGYKNWVFPNAETLKADFQEYKDKEERKWRGRAASMGFRFPIFPDFESFVSSLRNSPVIVLTREHDSHIQNRSHTGSLSSLKSLVSGYSTGPRDVDRIAKGMFNNEAIPYPIVLKGTRGEWIMAGNTRLDTSSILGVTPKVLLVDVRS